MYLLQDLDAETREESYEVAVEDSVEGAVRHITAHSTARTIKDLLRVIRKECNADYRSESRGSTNAAAAGSNVARHHDKSSPLLTNPDPNPYNSNS